MTLPVTCIVPARMDSSRFPGKPLVDIDGIPLVVRSARRAINAGCFQQVVVATEDQVIAQACQQHGLDSILTPTFPTGTDRVAWAAQTLGCPWVVNLQGDEPLFPLDLLQAVCRALPSRPQALWTAADLALSEADLEDPDVVKIAGPSEPHPWPTEGFAALDFHRDPLRAGTSGRLAVHIGLYAGSLETLQTFSRLPIPAVETERRIEPLRALASGMTVWALPGTWPRAAVDRREHISRVLDLLRREGAR